MNLVIRALTLNDQPLSQAIVGCFDDHGGTIGRSDTNTLTLPDPERHISRLQAEVIAHEGAFHVRNAATANPIFINGRALASGERCVLADHDELRIGAYVLGVTIEADNEIVRTIARGRAAVDARAVIVGSAVEHRTDPRQMAPAGGRGAGVAPSVPRPLAHAAPQAPPISPPSQNLPAAVNAAPSPSSSNPFADLLGPASGGTGVSAGVNNPFADLLAPAPPAAHGVVADPFAFLNSPSPPPPDAAQARAAAQIPAAPAAAPAEPAARLPDDFDPFADLAPPRPARASDLISPAGGNDLLGSVGASSGAAPSFEASFGLDSAAPSAGAMDPLAAFLAAPAPGSGASNSPLGALGAPSTDPFAMFGPAPGAAPVPLGPSVSNHIPELEGAYIPPPVLAPSPSPPPVKAPVPRSPIPAAAAPRAATPSPSAAAPPAQGAEVLWAAFCEGAGIHSPSSQGLSPDQMRVLGTILREAVDGTLRLMAVRAETKTELRAAVTTIRPRGNNPLKFSPNAQAALEQLVRPPLRGFMGGPQAMRDAMHDLVGHGIGTMAGMRAALAGVLARFEPAELERKLVGKSVMDSLLPMNRKARLWDLYLQHYGAIRAEAQDDFHTLFGAAFVAAYEDQLDRLQRLGGEGPT